MAELKPLCDSGDLGIVHAVGQAEPNRSHFEAMEEMERAAPGTSLRTGWIDRVLGSRDRGLSLPGRAGRQQHAGARVHRTRPGARDVVGGLVRPGRRVGRGAARPVGRTPCASSTSALPPSLSAPAQVALEALDTTADLQEAGYVPANGAVYPNTDLGKALRDVARLIKADVGLQVACVDYGDWDMHAGMGDVDGGWMADHLSELAGALAAFHTDLGSKKQDVTLVTLTEFGRRIEENGSGGTDHGYGQVVMMLGGGVNGGQVHGDLAGARGRPT